MNAIRTGFALFAASLVGVASGQDKTESPEYFPTTPGLVWTYTGKTALGAVPQPIVVRQSKAEKTADGVRVSRQSSNDLENWNEPEEFHVTSQGVFRTHVFGKELPTPLPLIKYPVKEGDTWSVEVPIKEGESATVTCTVGRQERVRVKAGTFHAVPIRTEVKHGAETQQATIWYAAGVGDVKSVRSRFRGLETVLELAAFEGKK
jgi:hypothetical protein